METKAPQKKMHRTLTGIVVSTKMKDTAVVSVSRFVKHPKYKKFIRSDKRYKAHDVGNQYKLGETVRMEETRPLSRHKRFIIVEKIAHAKAEPVTLE
ncbi:30S ribosomal protein S17 [Candidatus Parcubacteria bacterium]|nr:30S ribosomal protein S17 [Candidatus Parcubacteria bacterium]